MNNKKIMNLIEKQKTQGIQTEKGEEALKEILLKSTITDKNGKFELFKTLEATKKKINKITREKKEWLKDTFYK